MLRRTQILTVISIGLATAALQACGVVTLPGHVLVCAANCPPDSPPVVPTAPAPVTPPAPIVVPPYDGHVRWVSSWGDSRPETAAFTNAITINVDPDDPDAVTKAQAILASDTRSVIWFAPMFGYGAEGYELRSDASAAWQREKALIAGAIDRSIAVWLLDEPPDVAWSFWVDGGTRYDPNRYNDLMTTAAAMIHADFPRLAVAYNVGSVPAGLAIAPGMNLLGLETYGADWAAKLATVEGLTPTPIWLLPPAFVDGDPVVNDAVVADRFRQEFDAAKADPRITGLYAFLWCCDDTTTGDESFFTVSGPQLPRTREVFESIGREIR